MSKRLIERAKVDIGLVPQSLNGNATGRYHGMADYRRAVAVLQVGAMAAGVTAKIELLQATDAAGTGAKGIPTDAGQIASAVITANSGATVLQCVVGAPANGDTVTINGVAFTKAAATDAAKKEFADADGLVACVNAVDLGITASNNAGTVTFIATDPGETVITGAKTGAALTLSTIQTQAYVELDVSELDLANDYGYIAAKVTTSAAAQIGCLVCRGEGRWSPEQKVAASAIV